MISKQYRELLALVARNGAINGEKAMEVLKKEQSEADTETTVKMTEIFRELEDRINAGGELTNLDYAYLYCGAIISREILVKNINSWTAIVHEYDTNLIPKLYEIAMETDAEKKAELITKNFSEENLDKN